jgi:transcriptional regulator with XRE-family HTH domain
LSGGAGYTRIDAGGEGGQVVARLGQVLRQARESKGCSWREIEAATGLWPEYVEALEREEYYRFSSAAHLRSALRLYGRYLGLDTRHLLALLQRSLAEEQDVEKGERAALPGQSYNTLVAALLASLALAICAIVGLYGYRWLKSGGIAELASVATGPGKIGALPSPTVLPSPTPYQPISSTSPPMYTITATLDYAGHSLAVEERIDYANRSDQVLDDIVLNVFPNYTSGVFTLEDLRLEYGTGPTSATHELEDLALRVSLPKGLQPGRVVTLLVDFALDLPYIDPADSFTTGSLGWSENAIDGGHWYPAVAPRLPDQGWYTFSYHPVGDPYVMEEGDYDVRIDTSEGITVVASGEEDRQGSTWRYRISQARSFAFAASDQYVSYSVDTGDTTVTSYYFPEHETAGVDVAEFAAEALETYGEQFGVVYPYADYRIAETEFAGGMEYSALSFLGSLWYETYPGGVRSQLIALLVHEVSHQWWYGLVGNDQVREPWLDEAMATYSELLFYKLRYPDDHLWAWDFEVFNWQPTGAIDGAIYDYADQSSYMNAVYRRGAQFVADLRHTMGEQDFYAFLQEYCLRQTHSLSTSDDFFSILSQYVSDEELSPLLEEYFAYQHGEGTP